MSLTRIKRTNSSFSIIFYSIKTSGSRETSTFFKKNILARNNHEDPPESSDFLENEPYLIPDIESSESLEDSSGFPVISNSSVLLNEDLSYENKAFKMLDDKNASFKSIMEHMHLDSNDIEGDSENSTIPEEVFDRKLDIVTAFENFPHLNRLDLQEIGPHKFELVSGKDIFSTPMNYPASPAHEDMNPNLSKFHA